MNLFVAAGLRSEFEVRHLKMECCVLQFKELFLAVTGHSPFPWQEALFAEFVEKRFRKACDVPTGLGKTSIIAVWMLALAHHVDFGSDLRDFPRRLIYVVNRRTVVDQATQEVKGLREALAISSDLRELRETLSSVAATSSDIPLAISTLRGEFADNGEWRNDPSRPAVIVGTVDMIGSRLLFGGYGCGFKSRPLNAGFLGQDALLVHDEAHLEPAFQELLTAIESEQKRSADFQPLRVMALTATSRSDLDVEPPIFSDTDRKHSEVSKRFNASKWIAIHSVEDERTIPERIAELALEHKGSGQAILVFARRLDHVGKIADRLNKAKLAVQTLTGTMRGFERDALTKTEIFARFVAAQPGSPPAVARADPVSARQQGTVYLVCTSAGEVGINISADHLVCDLTPFDSMAQRLGRVNRFGDGDARTDVVYTINKKIQDRTDRDVSNEEDGTASKKKVETPSHFDEACQRTLSLLQRLPQREDGRHNASPAALNDLPIEDRQQAFAPPPVVLTATDILFDAWALTSIRSTLPGRPAVADWLHGIAEWEPPEAHVAWREEVEIVTGPLLDRYKPEDLLEDYPLKPHELLRDRSERVFEELRKLESEHAESPIWIIGGDDSVSVKTLADLVKAGDDGLNDRIIVLPPTMGGLRFDKSGRSTGMLDGGSAFDANRRATYDIADQWVDERNNPRRVRVWDSEDPLAAGMRLVRTVDSWPDPDETEDDEQNVSRRYWRWYVRPRSADDDGSRSAREPQELRPHLKSAEDFAQALVDKLRLPNSEATAVKLAARWHDLGKHRRVWQRSIGNRHYPEVVLAKSGGRMRPLDLSNFRHEFGSLIDVSTLPEFLELHEHEQDLVLHLIAAHHGRARPHFPVGEAFDPERGQQIAAEVAREVPRRFARLQRKYGRWGLAYLESLLRAADA
ncbi:MAG: type I-G CRISPR-associated helicase/endonuclease Cas3g, partial [Candidatus Binataceae bacterium]